MKQLRSYTTIVQSKKLAEILPLESADMGWYYSKDPNAARITMWCGTKAKGADIPCWSLSALLDILPKQIGRYTKSLYWFDDAWHCEYLDEDHECRYGVSADNPLDACYEMILLLHDKNLI